jgi:hypothetical protein
VRFLKGSVLHGSHLIGSVDFDDAFVVTFLHDMNAATAMQPGACPSAAHAILKLWLAVVLICPFQDL